MTVLSKAFSSFLILWNVFMLLWGVFGFFEYFTQVALIIPLQNPTFPQGTQFIHWFLITLTGVTYLYGYLTRWKYTPMVMTLIFGMLASMCFIQTFDFMVNPYRYIAFVVECSMYIAISIYLFRSQYMQQRFGKLSLSQV